MPRRVMLPWAAKRPQLSRTVRTCTVVQRFVAWSANVVVCICGDMSFGFRLCSAQSGQKPGCSSPIGTLASNASFCDSSSRTAGTPTYVPVGRLWLRAATATASEVLAP